VGSLELLEPLRLGECSWKGVPSWRRMSFAHFVVIRYG
jgi:hypothetical protein